jgi:hypothetical protein
MKTTNNSQNHILESLHSSKRVVGLTHNFYRYPARMLPELACEIILQFSGQGDIILDPFMGGGTTIVEAIATGRKAIGIDINSLAVFITEAKTTPLSPRDHQLINQWAMDIDFSTEPSFYHTSEDEPRVKNFPAQARQIFGSILEQISLLPYPRQQQFARCCLLRLGQWAIDGKDTIPSADVLREKFLLYVEEMLASLNDLVTAAQKFGVAKNNITKQRILLHRSVVDADKDQRFCQVLGKPNLIVTSPPYPSVHMLYHRWQVAGRRETPAPYWFIDANDGHGASYYTCGSRSRLGLDIYFRTIKEIFESLLSIIHPKALVAQLVSFFDIPTQLPAYLQAMELAGYHEIFPIDADRTELWRTVPNRKWYNNIGASRGTGKEILLFHRPRT